MDPTFITPLYFLWPFMFILIEIRTQLLLAEVLAPIGDYAFRWNYELENTEERLNEWNIF